MGPGIGNRTGQVFDWVERVNNLGASPPERNGQAHEVFVGNRSIISRQARLNNRAGLGATCLDGSQVLNLDYRVKTPHPNLLPREKEPINAWRNDNKKIDSAFPSTTLRVAHRNDNCNYDKNTGSIRNIAT